MGWGSGEPGTLLSPLWNDTEKSSPYDHLETLEVTAEAPDAVCSQPDGICASEAKIPQNKGPAPVQHRSDLERAIPSGAHIDRD